MHLHPTSEADVALAVQEARASRTPLSIEGGGTRRGLGRPSQHGKTLSLAGLTGITLYEPAEMVIGGWAGTPLSDVIRTLDARGQMLPFEPMDHRLLLGSSGEPTIGAVAAGNISGPRRIMAGAARDSLIGVRFVNGRGEIIKNGGRVMKNVTGLDLVKLQAGAYGTLGVLTEVIFKVLPKPLARATLVFRGLSDAQGVAALCAAMGSPFEPTATAHLPSGVGESEARSVIRLEGLPEQMQYRTAELTRLLVAYGQPEIITDGPHDALWQAIRDAAPLAEPRDHSVWRVSVAPSKAPAFTDTIRKARALRHFYDWSGGLIWLATPETDNAGADLIQSTAAAMGGHATLVRGSDALRATIPVFQPLDPVVMQLQVGLKKSFDPDGILNPGRMVAGV
ncbi:MAG: FAD-binding protein [Beijerinckiaceae bacterium]